MLTDLSFLEPGHEWPPRDERGRLDDYEKNKALFEGEHAEVYEQLFERIERVIGNFREVVSYPVILNYQKLMSLKIADLLFGEEPDIKAGDENEQYQDSVDQIMANNDLINTSYETAIDISRYGDGLFYVYKGDEGGKIDITQPSMWFPIVDPSNVKRINYHVLAWRYVEPDGRGAEQEYLRVHIHERGLYTENIYQLSTGDDLNTVIYKLISQSVYTTGLDDFAIIQIPNILTSDRVHGYDDYADIDSILSELLVRVAQVSRVLDKHAAPSAQGPHTALEKDPGTGEWKLKMGNYFPRNSADDPGVEYITWDGQLESSFKQIEMLINQLYLISEMGPALLGSIEEAGAASSGTALRLRMISPLAKVKRIRMRFDHALKKAIKLCSQLGGKNITSLKDASLSIGWQDGLPEDPKERMEIDTKEYEAGITSLETILRRRGFEGESLEKEKDRIQEEQQAMNPMAPPPFSGDNVPGNEQGE